MDKQRYVIIDGDKVYVTEEVYRAYYRPAWRESKQRKARSEMECSLDVLNDNGFELISDEACLSEIIWDKLLLDRLYSVLSNLTKDERALLGRIFCLMQSEREIAEELGLSRSTVVYRKNKVLAKLKNFFEII